VAQLSTLGIIRAMKKPYIFILVLAAFIAGGIGGSWFEHHRDTDRYRFRNLDYQLGEVSSAFVNLQDLRKGDTNAVFVRLEGELNSGLVFLSKLNTPLTKDDPSDYGGMWPAIARYRVQYPWHTHDTNWDNRVAAALAEISKPTPY
jgi:hypothetical protein